MSRCAVDYGAKNLNKLLLKKTGPTSQGSRPGLREEKSRSVSVQTSLLSGTVRIPGTSIVGVVRPLAL
jgi:hypothetical protein